MRGEPDRPLDGGEEVDGAEREEPRQEDVLDLASRGPPRPAELLEDEEEQRRPEAREPDDELAVAEVLGAPRELHEREHEHGRERGEADEGLPLERREVVVARVVRRARPGDPGDRGATRPRGARSGCRACAPRDGSGRRRLRTRFPRRDRAPAPRGHGASACPGPTSVGGDSCGAHATGRSRPLANESSPRAKDAADPGPGREARYAPRRADAPHLPCLWT